MARALAAINGLIRNEQGQDLLEYGFVAVLIAHRRDGDGRSHG